MCVHDCACPSCVWQIADGFVGAGTASWKAWGHPLSWSCVGGPQRMHCVCGLGPCSHAGSLQAGPRAGPVLVWGSGSILRHGLSVHVVLGVCDLVH